MDAERQDQWPSLCAGDSWSTAATKWELGIAGRRGTSARLPRQAPQP